MKPKTAVSFLEVKFRNFQITPKFLDQFESDFEFSTADYLSTDSLCSDYTTLADIETIFTSTQEMITSTTKISPISTKISTSTAKITTSAPEMVSTTTQITASTTQLPTSKP